MPATEEENMSNEVQPEGNYYNKYEASNPIEKILMNNFFNELYRSIDLLIDNLSRDMLGGALKVLEAGCGEGELSNIIYGYLKRKVNNVEFDAFDISDNVIEAASKKYTNINFRVDNIYDISEKKKYDLIICSEVCEHLENPQDAIKNLMRLSSNLVLSVPNEPIWRILNIARGKYIKRGGNTPGHIQHWSKKHFIQMLKEVGIEPVMIRMPLPWIMVVGIATEKE